MIVVQIDLKDVKNYFFFFKMTSVFGDWLSPIGEMVEYWPYLNKVITINDENIDPFTIEKYDGTQEKINYYCNKGDNILQFEFTDEEEALYFKIKFGSK